MNSIVSAAAVATATAIPNVSIPASVDPVFAIIERHKALSIAFDAAVDRNDVSDDHPEKAALDEISRHASSELIEHADILFAFRPSSSAGVGALLRYISTLKDWQMPSDLAEPSEIRCLKMLCRSLSIALARSSDTPAISQAPDPLIEIGDKFDEAAKQQIETEARSNELFEPIQREIDAQATWPDDDKKWTAGDARTYLETKYRIIDDVGAPWTAVINELQNVHHWRTDELMRAIWAAPAHSLAGLGVKAKAAAFACNSYWDEPFDELNWDHKGTRALIEAVLDVAGLPPAPQFLGID